MKIKHFICLMLAVVMLMTLASCVPSTPTREVVTEDPPVRDPANTVVETTAEEQQIEAFVEAVCGEDLIRVTLRPAYAEILGEVAYIRTAGVQQFCQKDQIIVTFDTVEKSKASNEPIVIVANSVDFLPVDKKPVIYLYPETPTDCSVKLTLDGHLTCTYPDYDEGWDNFIAHPDGTLVFPDGKEYYCLYWEGVQAAEWDFSEGFCVKGEETAAFLEWALAAQGLTPREANEFIIYWLPRMQDNPYNVIAFQTDAYTDTAVLEITPKPDSLLRIMMAYYPSDEAVEIEAQSFEGFEREGFVAVEWGGVEVE